MQLRCALGLKTWVSVQQALTYEEMEVERDESEAESDDEEKQTYNPLKIPMGWDGRLIPH